MKGDFAFFVDDLSDVVSVDIIAIFVSFLESLVVSELLGEPGGVGLVLLHWRYSLRVSARIGSRVADAGA
jgi:hypothetical protein